MRSASVIRMKAMKTVMPYARNPLVYEKHLKATGLAGTPQLLMLGILFSVAKAEQ